jgi:tetratricopeptide (TPR) repeat protein
VTREIDFEFEEGGGRGSLLVPTAQICGSIMKHLIAQEVEAAASLLAQSAPEVGDQLLLEEAKTCSNPAREAMADMFLRAKDYRRAAKVALLMGDPERAAPLFEKSYEFEKAAELYKQVGREEDAARLLVRGHKFEDAAERYAKMGQMDNAAAYYERAGNMYEAARHWTSAKRHDRAIEALQKLKRNDDTWVAGTYLLGRLLEHEGHTDAAIERYVAIVSSRPCREDTVAIYERLARVYAKKGEKLSARRLYRDALTFDPSRTKAREKLEALGPPEEGEEPDVARAATVPKPVKMSQSLPPLPGAGKVLGKVTAVHPVLATLRGLPLFQDLSLDDLRALYDLGETAGYEEGKVIIEQDKPGEYMMVVIDGTVEVLHKREGQQKVLIDLSKGAALGEMSLVDEGPTSARVRARTKTTVFRWPIEKLRAHLASNDQAALSVLRVLSRTLSVRLREASWMATR